MIGIKFFNSISTVIKIVLIVYCVLISKFAYTMDFSIPKHETYDIVKWINDNGYIDRIYATGKIEPNTFLEFDRFVKDNNVKSAMVLFDSPGGSLLGAVALGEKIRKLGFSTRIAKFNNGKMNDIGICASACAYAFAGGVYRYYLGNDTRLGLHQFYSQGNVISNKSSQEISGLLVTFMETMGIDARAFSISTHSGPEEMTWLSAEDALRLRFANNGFQDTVAEIKLLKNESYLKIEQIGANASGRFLLNCQNKKINVSAGYVTTPEDAINKLEWTTQSFITIGNNIVQGQRKDNFPNGIMANGSVVWLSRTFNEQEVNQLLNSDSIGLIIGSDGFVTYSVSVNLESVRDKLLNYINNCR